MIPSSIAQPHFNGRPRNEVVRNEGPRYEPLPAQTSRMEERESSETLKLLMNMNNQILSLNKKVNDLQFTALRGQGLLFLLLPLPGIMLLKWIGVTFSRLP
jgi:hypothetical protein